MFPGKCVRCKHARHEHEHKKTSSSVVCDRLLPFVPGDRRVHHVRMVLFRWEGRGRLARWTHPGTCRVVVDPTNTPACERAEHPPGGRTTDPGPVPLSETEPYQPARAATPTVTRIVFLSSQQQSASFSLVDHSCTSARSPRDAGRWAPMSYGHPWSCHGVRWDHTHRRKRTRT